MKRKHLPRTVNPRRSGFTHHPVIAIGDEIYTERGEVFPLADLTQLLRIEPPSIVVGQNFARTLYQLDQELDGDPRWQFRLSPLTRELWAPNRARQKVTVARESVCTFFGWQRLNGHTQNHYHYPLDPMVFLRQTIYDLMPGDDSLGAKLLRWGIDVRAWCEKENLPIKPTSGGIAGQLLKDPRFYPAARRKVPRATNAATRAALPGNYYRLVSAVPNQLYRGVYLDQSSAHHYAASRITFPAANRLTAKGYFHPREVEEDGITRVELRDKPWLRENTKAFHRALSQHGLFFVKLFTPTPHPHVYAPPFMQRQGTRTAFVFSNELEYVRACGGEIRYIIAAWTSPDADPAIPRYAEWSLSELGASDDDRRRWLKATLLSTYGILAATPREMEFGYKRAENATPKKYPCGSALIDVQAKTVRGGPRESVVANVIHRGMVEAETRMESMRFASELHAHGLDVLAIYADSVFLNGRVGDIPLIRRPWRVQAELTSLRFVTSTAFVSDQMTKLPGVSGEARGWAAARRTYAADLQASAKAPRPAGRRRPRRPRKTIL